MLNPDTTPRIHFKNLDILRFLAAYMIVLLHCYFAWKIHFGDPVFITSTLSAPSIGKMETVINNFSFGVDVFFIISGFLITYLLLSEHEKTGKVDVLKFYIRRAFRIWPLYFLLLLIAPLLTYFYNEQSPGYLYHFFFAGNFDIIHNGTKSAATDHLWSICVEEHFYLFCPLLIAFIPMKRLPEVLLGIIALCIFFRGYVTNYIPNSGGIIYLHTLSRIDVLALGSLFGYLCYYKKIQFNHSLPIRLIIYSIFIFIFLNVSYVDSGTFLNTTVKKYFFVLAAVYWIGNFMFNPKAKFVSHKPNLLHQFGKVSYGIYMFNPVIIYVLLNAFSAFSFQNYFVFLLSVHAVLALTTFLSYRFFEAPFLALKEKYAVVQSGDAVKNTPIDIGAVEEVEVVEAVEIIPPPPDLPIPVMVEKS